VKRFVHVITPGDHFSPLTGSAIPTVVHGLSVGSPQASPRPAVAVAKGTYPERYTSADIIEYAPASPHGYDRYLDAALSRFRLPRASARRNFSAVLVGQRGWESSVVLAHNAPQLITVVDTDRHVPVLYAHNHILRTYTRRESARVLAAAPVVVTVSNSLADQLAKHMPPSHRDRLRVVRNGVDVETFKPRASPGRTESLEVFFIGRMIRDKGPDVLIEALLRLGRRDIRLTIVGASDFDPRAALTAYERNLRSAAAPLGDQVRFRPFLPRAAVAEQLRQADVVVVPSRWPDPCPLTVMEGMAAGAAVVGSDIGGIPESLRGTGLIVPPDEPSALAAALEALADDEAYRMGVAAACRDFAERHDWTWAAQRLDEVLSPLR
jgi:glycosyltransferase involved in cell wall biosynthesis